MSISTSKPRLPGPDILRGLAALSVIVVHLIASSGINYGQTIALVGSKFTASVTLFFAISAFSISYAYGADIFDRKAFGNFYIKRFFRIAPLFYVAMIFQGTVVYLDFKKLPSLLDLLMSSTFLFSLVPKMQNGFVWAGWSLGIEWIFYLLYPFLILLCFNRAITWVLWAMCAVATTSIAGINADPIEIYMNIITLLIFFVSGFVVYSHLGEISKVREILGRHSDYLSGATIILLSLYLLHVYSSGGPLIINIYVTYSLTWIAMLFASAVGVPKFMINPVTRFLGEASYSLYLTHAMIIYIAKKAGLYNFIDGILSSGSIKFALAFACTSAIVCFISYFTYNYIEKPGIRLGKKFISRST